ncbi:MAG: hypothetical protein Q8P41_13250 [Pseudomonadota bacterium]|nr:hypothetical protein [Pseudomonadota bacterium]
MNAALRADPTALRVNLTAPTTSVRIGPFAFDGLKALVGMDLGEALAPLMIGSRFQRPGAAGVVDVYPLAIPDGEGLTIPIKLIGEIGFYNLQGALVLVVPPAAVDVVKAQLASELAAGEALGPRFRTGASGGTVAEFAVRLRAGMRKAVPLGRFGEIGVEAG